MDCEQNLRQSRKKWPQLRQQARALSVLADAVIKKNDEWMEWTFKRVDSKKKDDQQKKRQVSGNYHKLETSC